LDVAATARVGFAHDAQAHHQNINSRWKVVRRSAPMRCSEVASAVMSNELREMTARWFVRDGDF